MRLRPAQPEDALAIARVHVRSWQVAYRDLLPNDHLNQLRPEDRASKYDFTHTDPQKPHTIIADDNGLITGFATTMPSRDPALPDHGELAAIYVDPNHWNHGIGAALITAARTHLVEQGFRHAYLWLLHGNTRAARFYTIDGWTPNGDHRTDTVWGVTVNEARYLRALHTS
jgi:GNAT superfamily N-acetyltransferase